MEHTYGFFFIWARTELTKKVETYIRKTLYVFVPIKS